MPSCEFGSPDGRVPWIVLAQLGSATWIDLSRSRKHTSFYSQEEGMLRRGEWAWHRQQTGLRLERTGSSCLLFNRFERHFQWDLFTFWKGNSHIFNKKERKKERKRKEERKTRKKEKEKPPSQSMRPASCVAPVKSFLRAQPLHLLNFLFTEEWMGAYGSHDNSRLSRNKAIPVFCCLEKSHSGFAPIGSAVVTKAW